MNLYLRYFDHETLVSNADEAVDFLRSLQEIKVTPELVEDIHAYAASDVAFPKRYKVRAHIYFIVIKTLAKTMSEFKQKKALRSNNMDNKRSQQDTIIMRLMAERSGWYEGDLTFKRVVLVPGSNKHEYRDTRFVACCKALSGMDCYNRIVEHLRSRVDSRSQFSSAKGKNFRFRYLGMWK